MASLATIRCLAATLAALVLGLAGVGCGGGGKVIIGGSTPSLASIAIYSFDPRTGQVGQIGHLAHPVTHAGAATLGNTVFLVGGRRDNLNAQTSGVWAINPVTGAVTAGVDELVPR